MPNEHPVLDTYIQRTSIDAMPNYQKQGSRENSTLFKSTTINQTDVLLIELYTTFITSLPSPKTELCNV